MQTHGGPQHQRADEVVVDLLNDKRHDGRQSGGPDIGGGEGDDHPEKAANPWPEKGHDVESSTDQSDQQPERQIDPAVANAEHDADDDRHQQLASEEPADCGVQLGSDEGHLSPVLFWHQSHGALPHVGEVDQEVESENRAEQEHEYEFEDARGGGSNPVEDQRENRVLVIGIVEVRHDPVVVPEADIDAKALGDADRLLGELVVDFGKVCAEHLALLDDARNHQRRGKDEERNDDQEPERRSDDPVDVPLLKP